MNAIRRLFSRGWRVGLCILFCVPAAGMAGSTSVQVHADDQPLYLPVVTSPLLPYLNGLIQPTYDSLSAMVEPSTGLIHDRFDASLFDIFPQLAMLRRIPYPSMASGASLVENRCTGSACRRSGDYGLQLTYSVPAGTWTSYNIDSYGFDARAAAYLELWVKGAKGGERFELVLWSNCGQFPGRPNSAVITARTGWERKRIPLADYAPYTSLASVCRVSIGFNDALHKGGTVYLDQATFVNKEGNQVKLAVDEYTNLSNVGLYMASVVSAVEMGIETRQDAVTRLSKTMKSLEVLQKWHGFPQTHIHAVSLRPFTGDRCPPDDSNAPGGIISTVDSGVLAAGLIAVHQGLPELAARSGALLEAMEWDWLYDPSAGLPYGCRGPDGRASTGWHYDWLAADSRLAHFIGIGSREIPAGSWANLRDGEGDKVTGRCNAKWHFQPGWSGGGLFMQSLPALFIDEAGSSLEISRQNLTSDMVCLAQKVGAPAWCWSATTIPPYGEGYCGYGANCDDFLSPHACLLGMQDTSGKTAETALLKLESAGMRKKATDGVQSFDYGLRSSYNWRTKQAAPIYLSLEQGMAFLSLANYQSGGILRKWFCKDEITKYAAGNIADYAKSCDP